MYLSDIEFLNLWCYSIFWMTFDLKIVENLCFYTKNHLTIWKIITIREFLSHKINPLCQRKINLLFEYWNVVGDDTFRTTGIRPNLFPSASSEFVRWWSLRKSDISIELHCLPRFDGLRRNWTASVSPSSIGNGRS